MDKLRPLDFFLTRSPIYHYERLTDFFRQSENKPIDEIIESVKALAYDNAFGEAVFLASPSFYFEIQKTLNGKSAKDDIEKLAISVFKYFARMCFRSTPFGLFSTTSKGYISSSTKASLADIKKVQKHVRLDMDYLSSLVDNLFSFPGIKRHLLFYSNPSIYFVGDNVRYIEYDRRNNARTYGLTSVVRTDALDLVLKECENGVSIDDLATTLIDDEISYEDALAYVNELVDSKLLLSELEANLTGDDYFERILSILKRLPSNDPYVELLEKIKYEISQISKTHVGIGVEQYIDMVKWMPDAANNFSDGRLLQIDAVRSSSDFSLNKNVVMALEKTLGLMARVASGAHNDGLKKFKETFYERYENQEVSLLEVLDADMGIGYPVRSHAQSDISPLITGIILPEREKAQRTDLSKWHRFLLAKIIDAQTKGEEEILITEEAISTLFPEGNTHKIPSSFSVICEILSSSVDAIDSGDFKISCTSIGGPSFANLMGRFCYTDAELHKNVVEAIKEDDQRYGDVVVAEISHLPQPRIGNILSRPALRTYEIPLLCHPGTNTANTISLNDLMISLKGDKIVLRSRRLNKRVIPRMSTAHNYEGNYLPHYKFLCALQNEETTGMHLDLAHFSNELFVPRIRYDKVILSKRRWLLHHEYFGTKNTEEEWFAKLQSFCKVYRVPQQVVLQSGDHKLLLDLKNVLCKKILFQEFKKQHELVLTENLYDDSTLFTQGPHGKHVCEFMLGFLYENFKYVPVGRFNQPPVVARKLIPGSECLYLKVYCGLKTSDKVLSQVIHPLADKLVKDLGVSKWFFVRYADPHWHIRVRFFMPPKNCGLVVARFYDAIDEWFSNKTLWKLQIDTYEREIERYGALNIENSELIFFHDSVACVKLIDMLSKYSNGDDERWLVTLVGIDMMLEDFKLSLDQKYDLISSLSVEFCKEHNADNETVTQLAKKFRSKRSQVENALNGTYAFEHELKATYEIFKERSRALRDPIVSILQQESNGILEVSKSFLVTSYVHMFVNRMIRSKQRIHEMVLYDFLNQFYRSQIARRKKLAFLAS